MFEELEITKEDYIDYYSLLEKEYESLSQLMLSPESVELAEDYYSSNSREIYMELIGVTENELNELAEKIPQSPKPLDPQPELPFKIMGERFNELAQNEDGEYIFVSVSSGLFFDDMYSYLYFDLNNRIVKDELTRASLQRYIEAVSQYDSEDAHIVESAKEFAKVLEIIERTVM